ncbi:RES family NAD+ phosphorylase [Mucilaginibacter ginkgonis]|uniref:RES family NAD+ phosphorylase n=1 Tax=Mucilaginibacter ginkgonis TaxID=2682091 RepID=A0A6I4I3S2_9SPHI|nr:RES family NAD+ phosphorylase [Mucilaginibacter ginkgonis]QQL48636.1 RES family NAD+ phosphorylase [Mucilaginibacter ginkgonis]
MLLYRIVRKPYAQDLSGTGSRLFGGRWNSIGKSLTYLADSQSLAVLEVLVHIRLQAAPADHVLVTLYVPEDIIDINTDKLPSRWNDVYPPALLRKYGDDFVDDGKSLLLKVPSAVVPQQFNYLMNPAHPKMAEVKVISAEPFSFDSRLM